MEIEKFKRTLHSLHFYYWLLLSFQMVNRTDKVRAEREREREKGGEREREREREREVLPFRYRVSGVIIKTRTI